MNMPAADLVVHNIGQLLTMKPSSGPSGGQPNGVACLGIIPNAAIAMGGGRILWLGPDRELADVVMLPPPSARIDAGGRVALPGLIDCHTHLVFAGSRANEFSLRIAGASYEQILAAGGGIHSTVQETRQASEEQLIRLGMERLDRFLSFGVTTLEVKSGYGLDLETEIKILRCARTLGSRQPVSLVGTFLGAHTVPLEFRQRRGAYLELLIQEMIPKVAAERLATFCDVFCEQGAFTLAETRQILEAGLKAGLRPKLHAEQLSRSGSVALAIELGAVSVDHLEHANEQDAAALAKGNSVAVLLPGATLFAGKSRYAPGRMLADTGCRVAVSTDFNPGTCLSENLPLMLNLACVCCKLQPEEALLGATRHAASAMGLSEIGSLEPGKVADLLILRSHDWRDIVYHFGINHTWRVIKRGEQVVPRTNAPA